MRLPILSDMNQPFIMKLQELGGSAKPKEMYESLSKYFNLSKQQLSFENENGESKWENRVRWVRRNLVNEGKLKSDSKRGIWELSDTNLEDTNYYIANEDNACGRKISQMELEGILVLQKKIGDLGELLVLEKEKVFLNQNGLIALANNVENVSVENCKLGYDIKSYFSDGSEKYIEVKSSTSESKEFYLTINELRKAEKYKKSYQIHIVTGIDLDKQEAKEITILENLDELINQEQIVLTPIKWRVSMLDD